MDDRRPAATPSELVLLFGLCVYIVVCWDVFTARPVITIRSGPDAHSDVPGSNDNGNTNRHVPHKQAAAASSVPNVLRCHRITRASMSTMSHQLAASRGLPQTAPGLAMKAPVASQS